MAFYRCGSENKSEEPSLGIMGNGGKTGTDKWMPVAEYIVTNADPINMPVAYWVHKDMEGNETIYPFDYEKPWIVIVQAACANIGEASLREYLALRTAEGTSYTLVASSATKMSASFNSNTRFLERYNSNYTYMAYVKIALNVPS